LPGGNRPAPAARPVETPATAARTKYRAENAWRRRGSVFIRAGAAAAAGHGDCYSAVRVAARGRRPRSEGGGAMLMKIEEFFRRRAKILTLCLVTYAAMC
jgi:hypothetical protein